MSMSVPYGFRFVTDDLGEVHRLMTDHRAVIAGLCHTAQMTYLARRATKVIDLAALEGVACADPLSQAYVAFAEGLRGNERGNVDPRLDFTFNVSVLPWEGRIYGAVHTLQGEWASDLVSRPWAEPFDYTDSTDQDEVPADEYEARRDVWNGISSRDPGSRLSGCGFQVTFHPSNRPMPPKAILALVPDRPTRCWERARDRVIHARMQALIAEGGDPMRSGIAAAIWFTDPEGQAAAKAEAETIGSRLPEITLDVVIDGIAAFPAA